MSGNLPVEEEIKIPCESLDKVRAALDRLGARCAAPSRREVNVLFDTAAGEIAAAGRALRLRRIDGRWILTLKGPVTWKGPVKTREELETAVANGEILTEIFERLGLRPVVRYEKDRETWRLDRVEIVLDRTRMGDFVEIEGPRDALATVARGLGLDPSRAARGSYVSLWAQYRRDHPELDLPADMIFEP
ncbi:MAG: class IV adenylate cyclase [Acidobacteria bacterium]|nr:class IV adenylate cyclase [Acidobacteriota bacterium]